MKAYFLSRHIREKMLILGLVIIAIAFWLPSLIGRTNQLLAEKKLAESKIAEQQPWLDRRDEIDAEEAAAVNKLKPELSFDKLKLTSEITKMAEAASVNPAPIIGAATSSKATSRQLSISSIRVTLNNVDMPTLVSFYRELAKRSPYISISDCTITVRQARGGRGGFGAAGAAGANPTFRNGVAAVVQNTGNGVTDTGAPAAGAAGRRGGALAAATDPNAPVVQGGRRGGANGLPVLPGNMNVTFVLTAVAIVRPGAPVPAAGARSGAVPVVPAAAKSA
jgi:hypothetical protein